MSDVILKTLSPRSEVIFQHSVQAGNLGVNTTTPLELLIVQRVTIPLATTYMLQYNDIPTSVRYVLFQAHSQVAPLLMQYETFQGVSPTSFTDDLVFGSYVNSTNAGLAVLLEPNSVSAAVYVTNPHPENVSAAVVVAAYSQQAPIPGACNMEFDVEIAPYLRISYDRLKTTMDYQRANLGYPRTQYFPPSCDQTSNMLTYHIYQYFMTEHNMGEDEYFNAIDAMLTANSVEVKALPGAILYTGPYSRAAFSVIPGQGVVYNVIVRDARNSALVAAYTPAATYNCDLTSGRDSCNILIRPFGWIFCVFCAMIGFFLCFTGHRFFKIEMFVFGFLATSMITFIFITKFTDSDYSVRVSMTILTGVVGGLAWVALWWFAGVPIISVLLVGLDLGFLIACVAFYTPFGDLDVMRNDLNYWTSFACIMLIPATFLLCVIHKLSIIGCAVVGSYGTILLIDRYLGTSLIYIVINVMKRAVISDFSLLNTSTPFQISEICLCGVWAFMAIAGITVQVVRERKRPPFPPPPYLTWRATSLRASQMGASIPVVYGEERQPLLSDTVPDYESIAPTAPAMSTSTSAAGVYPPHIGQRTGQAS